MSTPTLFTIEAPAVTTAAGPRPAITITVHGLAAPQGSKRHVGRGIMVESSKKVAPWRQDVKHAALAITETHPDWTVLDGPLAVAMTFTFDRPKGHYRTGRNAHLLRESAPTRPAGMPDLSKLVRSTEDALTGVVWKDDARVVDYVRLGKWYAGTPAEDVLTVPGCVIRVWPVTEAVQPR
jgi:Holliday junction resolvase RusA-like endonuclease